MVAEPDSPPAVVVGAGLAGAACALELARAGIAVQVLDRGRRPGGRLGLRTLRNTGTPWDGRVVDVGASYITARTDEFSAVVADLVDSGVLRAWTDTFAVAEPDGIIGTRTGPIRYAAPAGLRGVVDDLLSQGAQAAGDRGGAGFVVEPEHRVQRVWLDADGACGHDDRAARSVALCMPGPHALPLVTGQERLRPLASAAERVAWEPVLVLTAVFAERCWPDLDGVFVNDDPVLTWIADDGRRRGDDAPVLVAHAGPVLSAAHLRDPDSAMPLVLAAMRRVLRLTQNPDWVQIQRWSLAKPLDGLPEPFARCGPVGVAGDWWHCDSGFGPRTESAFCSGAALGRALAQ